MLTPVSFYIYPSDNDMLIQVNEHANRYKMTLVLTFDQSLWFNTKEIGDVKPLSSDVSKVVVA